MNLKSLFALLICICLISCSNQDTKIKDTVNKWNELHNTRNAENFLDLYADDVLFYGRQTPKETCYIRKKTFLTSSFQQDIISPITVSYYSSGTIKCDFTKRTRYRKEKVREYYCYLLLQKKSGKYLVTGESDLLSDQKRKTKLYLGDKIAGPSGNTFYYVFATVLLLTGGIIYFVRRKKQQKATEWELFKEQYKAPAEPEKKNAEALIDSKNYDENFISRVKEAVMQEMKNHFPENSPEKKGYLFETFVVERFDPAYFNLINWRSDKYHKGIYATSNRLPDLEYHFKTSYHDCRIGIECKWRSEFNKNKIELAREDQLEGYWKYAVDNAITVFIILGVGGKPDNPEDLYIIPLEKVQGTVMYKNQLREFRRNTKRMGFFYDAVNRRLD